MNPIPLSNKNFQKIIGFYLFECPARTRSAIPKAERDENDPQAKYKCTFSKVSKRGKTFDERGLDGAKLNSLRAAMKRVTNVELIVLDDCNQIPQKAAELANKEYLIIWRNEANTSVTEGFFYCIRNSLAHGSFDIDGQYYLFRNESRDKIKGMGRIKERSLLAWINLVEMGIDDIKKAGKRSNASF